MKLPLILSTLFCILTISANAQQCVNADPNLTLNGISGDYEVTVDPQDVNHVIYTSNTANGPSNIVVAQLDGTTGIVSSPAPTIIANNYNGFGAINGPEFVQKPTGELGILFANNTDGLHGVFRSLTPSSWDAFDFNEDTTPVNNNAPALLPATGPWADYPRAIPSGLWSYGAVSEPDSTIPGHCTGACYGYLTGGTLTDVSAIANTNNLTITAVTQNPNRDGYLYFSATDALNNNTLYETQIDGEGSITPHTSTKLTNLPTPIDRQLIAGIHPITHDTIIFGVQALSINVWRQAHTGGQLTLLGTVATADGADHFRVVASDTQLVLHYLDLDGTNAGSYTVAISPNMTIGQVTKISNVSRSAELIWLPAANQFALYDNKRSGWPIRRCWVNIQ